MRVAAAEHDQPGPYAQAAALYFDAGWHGTLPLPARAKKSPPTGFTGDDGVYPSRADIQAWLDNGHAAGNIALRMPDIVIGIDVDCYDGKHGAQTLTELEAKWGPLPATWTSSSRSDGSSIRFYRVPPGMTWPSDLGDSIEIIRRGHRYAVVWPSIHPEGRPYRWNSQEGVAAVGIPTPADLTVLPPRWIEGLVHYRPETGPTGWTNPELDRLVNHGIPAGKRQDDILRDVVWQLRMQEVAKEAVWSVWKDIARKTVPTRPDEPWTRQDFDRHWRGADRKAPPIPTVLPGSTTKPQTGRQIHLTSAASIHPRPVRWLWDNRIALGSLALIGGREGIGKSTVAYTLAGQITRGTLIGQYQGNPKAVIVAATEDSWEHTIVPRLMAANADLHKVYRVDVTTPEGTDTGLSLPRDLQALQNSIVDVDAALLLLDPLMSRLDAALDSHKDSEVRLALEPIVGVADKTGAAALGLIHVNKGTSGDPLTLLMGSRAFPAVARAVLFVMVDPDDEHKRLLGQPKNNLGPSDTLSTLTFTIESEKVAETDEGPIYTGKLIWGEDSERDIREALASAGEDEDARTATSEAAGWLKDYVNDNGGTADSADIKRDGHQAGHSMDALKRARKRLKLKYVSYGMPRRTRWEVPGTQLEQQPGESIPTALTTPTGETRGVQSAQSVQLGESPGTGAPTEDGLL